MSILDRFSDVVKSNINALIDRAEDPEKMANQIILDLEKIQKEVTEGVALSIAEEKRLKTLVEQNRNDAERWENRAVEALKKGEEAMAREALLQKQKAEGDYETYRLQHEKQVAAVSTLKDNLRQMNEKIEEARRRRDNLVARSTSTKAQSSAAKATSTASTLDAMGKLDKMERKVEQQAAMAEAYSELNVEQNMESQFKKMEQEKSLDDELAALKEKLKNEEGS
jgi:phage shock protein A